MFKNMIKHYYFYIHLLIKLEQPINRMGFKIHSALGGFAGCRKTLGF